MFVLYSISHNKRNWIFLVIIFNSDTVCYLSRQCNLYAVEYVRHFSLEDWAFKKSYGKTFHQGLTCDLQLYPFYLQSWTGLWWGIFWSILPLGQSSNSWEIFCSVTFHLVIYKDFMQKGCPYSYKRTHTCNAYKNKTTKSWLIAKLHTIVHHLRKIYWR